MFRLSDRPPVEPGKAGGAHALPRFRWGAGRPPELPGPGAHAIVWAALAFTAAALLWAANAELDIVTVGEATVIPSRHVQVVQNLEGGIVAEIPVVLGQAVERDQVLMRIDDTRFRASFEESRVKDDALRMRIARLSAEERGAPFVPPEPLARSNPRLAAQERSVHDARQRELRAAIDVLERQAEQRRQELTEKRSREGQLRASHALVARELAMTRPLLDKGVVSQVELLRLERQTTDLQGELDATTIAIPRLEAAIAEVRQRIHEVQARFGAEASRELSQVRADQASLSAANVANEDRVVRTQVRAPVAGIVKTIRINTLGGVVQPGMELFEIVPADDGLLVEARVRPSDIAFLRVGQEATVKISAYDFSIYGGFKGVVDHISADAITPDRQGERAEPYYRVRVRTTSDRAIRRGEELQILPGMTATVDILTGKRTVLQYLAKPLIRGTAQAMRER